MTRDEILKLEAGAEMDALINAKVMKVRTVHRNGADFWEDKYTGGQLAGQPFWYFDAPHFSTDIAAAWEVVEKIGGELTLAFRGKYWFCDFGNQDVWEYSQSATPSLAICRAALLAVMELE